MRLNLDKHDWNPHIYRTFQRTSEVSHSGVILLQMHLFSTIKLPSVLLPTLQVNIYKEIREVADVNSIFLKPSHPFVCLCMDFWTFLIIHLYVSLYAFILKITWYWHKCLRFLYRLSGKYLTEDGNLGKIKVFWLLRQERFVTVSANGGSFMTTDWAHNSSKSEEVPLLFSYWGLVQ